MGQKKQKNYYQENKELGRQYRESQENISFTDFKKKLGYQQGRPKKDNKIKIA